MMRRFDHEGFSAQLSLLGDEEMEKIWGTYDEILEQHDEEEVSRIKEEYQEKEIELFHRFLEKAGIGKSSQEALQIFKMYDL
jgi:hypothetical protein